MNSVLAAGSPAVQMMLRALEHLPDKHNQADHGRKRSQKRNQVGSLAQMSDDGLLDLFGRISAEDELDERALRRVIAEMDRRENPRQQARDPKPAADAWADKLTPQERKIDRLLAKGVDFIDAYAQVHGEDPQRLRRQDAAAALGRRAGETVDQAVRRSYEEWVDIAYLQAEAATRGHMLSREGKAAGIDPRSLFSGPLARAQKYASEDLRRWWADNPRLNATQFRAQVLRRDVDMKAAAATVMASNAKDFA